MTDLRSAHATLATRARTFRLASRFLPSATRDDAAVVYALCRAIDDAADERRSAEELADIGRELSGEVPAQRPIVRGFLEVASRRGVPVDAALELVEGCTMDLGRVRVTNQEHLLRYAYLVAGTVGRMMTAVLGSRNEAAVPHAISLGIGMQLTNIARDVAEDGGNDRVYLPATWLHEQGIDQDSVARGTADETKLVLVVRRLVALADHFYRHGEAGLGYLPWRTRIGIGVASRVYRAIGHAVARRGARALSDRTLLSPLARVRHAFTGMIVSLFARPTEAG